MIALTQSLKRIAVVAVCLATCCFVGNEARAVTLTANIHNITSNTTQNYTFTDGPLSVTLQALFTPTGAGVPAGSFSSLDAATRVGNRADGSGDTQNHFRTSGFAGTPEGFDVQISVLSTVGPVDLSSIDFKFSELGVRILDTVGSFDWSSSATAVFNTSGPASELDRVLDSTFYSGIATTPYNGSFVMTGGLSQLTSRTSSQGIVLDATFSAIVVPEPATVTLGVMGLIGLAARRRRAA